MSRLPPAFVFLAWSAVGCGGSVDSDRSGIPAFSAVPTPGATSPGAPASVGATSDSSSTLGGSTGTGASPTGETPSADLPLGAPVPGVPGSMPGVPGSTGVPLGSALPRSTPEAEGLSSAGLLSLVSALDGGAGEVHSLMLVRHGKVVAEGWCALLPRRYSRAVLREQERELDRAGLCRRRGPAFAG